MVKTSTLNSERTDNRFYPSGEPFPYGLPPGSYFQYCLDDLEAIVKRNRRSDSMLTVSGISLIALVAYFEGYCKDQFASLINICPQLLLNFVEKRSDISIPVSELVDFDLNIKDNVGFLLSEKFDFGTAKSINSLYFDLIKCSPFSSADKKVYEKLLSDRNLLVHHNGLYTYKYYKQHLKSTNKGIYGALESMRISKNDYFKHANFLCRIVKKINNHTYNNLLQEIKINQWIPNNNNGLEHIYSLYFK